MKIYFSGSIRGGREQAESYALMIKEISFFGQILSEFVGDQTLTSYGTLNMTDTEIYNRDTKMIVEADIVIADITIPSLGVGYEIAYAEKLGKKIYCLYHRKDDSRISAMIAGNQNCQIFIYQSQSEIPEIIKNIFK